MCVTNSHSVACILSWSMISFDEKKFLILILFHLTIFIHSYIFPDLFKTPKVMNKLSYVIFQSRVYKIFLESSDNNYFRFCGSYDLYHNYLTLPLQCENSHGNMQKKVDVKAVIDCVNAQVCLCVNKTQLQKHVVGLDWFCGPQFSKPCLEWPCPVVLSVVMAVLCVCTVRDRTRKPPVPVVHLT